MSAFEQTEQGPERRSSVPGHRDRGAQKPQTRHKPSKPEDFEVATEITRAPQLVDEIPTEVRAAPTAVESPETEPEKINDDEEDTETIDAPPQPHEEPAEEPITVIKAAPIESPSRPEKPVQVEEGTGEAPLIQEEVAPLPELSVSGKPPDRIQEAEAEVKAALEPKTEIIEGEPDEPSLTADPATEIRAPKKGGASVQMAGGQPENLLTGPPSDVRVSVNPERITNKAETDSRIKLGNALTKKDWGEAEKALKSLRSLKSPLEATLLSKLKEVWPQFGEVIDGPPTEPEESKEAPPPPLDTGPAEPPPETLEPPAASPPAAPRIPLSQDAPWKNEEHDDVVAGWTDPEPSPAPKLAPKPTGRLFGGLKRAWESLFPSSKKVTAEEERTSRMQPGDATEIAKSVGTSNTEQGSIKPVPETPPATSMGLFGKLMGRGKVVPIGMTKPIPFDTKRAEKYAAEVGFKTNPPPKPPTSSSWLSRWGRRLALLGLFSVSGRGPDHQATDQPGEGFGTEQVDSDHIITAQEGTTTTTTPELTPQPENPAQKPILEQVGSDGQHNSITILAQRVLETQNGFDTSTAKDLARQMAENQGLINSGLNFGAIGNLSIGVNQDAASGGYYITFHNSTTGETTDPSSYLYPLSSSPSDHAETHGDQQTDHQTAPDTGSGADHGHGSDTGKTVTDAGTSLGGSTLEAAPVMPSAIAPEIPQQIIETQGAGEPTFDITDAPDPTALLAAEKEAQQEISVAAQETIKPSTFEEVKGIVVPSYEKGELAYVTYARDFKNKILKTIPNPSQELVDGFKRYVNGVKLVREEGITAFDIPSLSQELTWIQNRISLETNFPDLPSNYKTLVEQIWDASSDPSEKSLKAFEKADRAWQNLQKALNEESPTNLSELARAANEAIIHARALLNQDFKEE